MTLHTACRVDEFATGSMRAFSVGERRTVALQLADDCDVRCALHRGRFAIRGETVADGAGVRPGTRAMNVVRGEQARNIDPVQFERGRVRVYLP